MNWSDRMPQWMRRQAPAPEVSLTPEPPPRRRMSGDYLALYTYLDNRYARTVVLTFQQIESLLGFPLPTLARSDAAWWTAATHGPNARHEDAWKLANRTAAPNLLARTVVFERGS